MTHSRCSSGVWALLLAGIVGGVAAQPTAKTAPLNMGLSGQSGQIFQPDPKLPGKFLWKMYVQGGSVVSQDNGYLGRLTGVTALLYQRGVPSARMKAPTATGNSTQQIIVANGPGRVMMWSLTQPGTTMEANKMTWYAKKNQIVATGNVVYHNGRTGVTMIVPGSMNADTVLKTASWGKGSGTLP